MVTWLGLGLAGWFTLMGYRIYEDGLPNEASFLSYVRGFALCILLGPLCFVFLGWLIYKEVTNDQAPY